jgi:hypothetical protein
VYVHVCMCLCVPVCACVTENCLVCLCEHYRSAYHFVMCELHKCMFVWQFRMCVMCVLHKCVRAGQKVVFFVCVNITEAHTTLLCVNYTSACLCGSFVCV